MSEQPQAPYGAEKTALALPVGFHPNVPPEAYHADCADGISLSASIAKIMVSQSPKHAWSAHPKLGGAEIPDEDQEPEREAAHLILGRLIHRMVLGVGEAIVICEETSWRKKAAQEFKETALAAGQIPALRKTYNRAAACHAEVMRQLGEQGFRRAFRHGQNELTMIWRDDGVLYRAMLDNLDIDEERGTATIWDLKTVGRSAHPKACASQINSLNYDLGEAIYKRGVEILRPDLAGRIEFRWAFVEVVDPFVCVPVETNGEFRAIGLSKALRAHADWKTCLASGIWPGYARALVKVEPPGYALNGEFGAPSLAPSLAEQQAHIAANAVQNQTP